MINSYSFGCMEINGKPYHKDLMILPDGTIYPHKTTPHPLKAPKAYFNTR
jgi:hypothetical protein